MPLPAQESNEPRLTAAQRQFCELYLGQARGNAVEAARLMGISDDDRVLRRMANRYLNHPSVRFHIEKWASRHMAPTEILAILASHARGDMGDFWRISEDPAEPPGLDLRKAAELGLTHLIRKLKIGKDGAVEIELYDAQAALRDLMKVHGMQRHDSNTRFTIEHVLKSLPHEIQDQLMASLVGESVGALPPGEDAETDNIDYTDAEYAVYTEDDEEGDSPDKPLETGTDDAEPIDDTEPIDDAEPKWSLDGWEGE